MLKDYVRQLRTLAAMNATLFQILVSQTLWMSRINILIHWSPALVGVTGRGLNPRYMHTFCDEDQMSVLKGEGTIIVFLNLKIRKLVCNRARLVQAGTTPEERTWCYEA